MYGFQVELVHTSSTQNLILRGQPVHMNVWIITHKSHASYLFKGLVLIQPSRNLSYYVGGFWSPWTRNESRRFQVLLLNISAPSLLPSFKSYHIIIPRVARSPGEGRGLLLPGSTTPLLISWLAGQITWENSKAQLMWQQHFYIVFKDVTRK